MNETTRRDVLLGGLAAVTADISLAQSNHAQRFLVAVAGDYEGVALKLAPWDMLGSDAEVVSFNKPFASTAETIEALREFHAVALMRERVPMPRAVLEKLPRLKLIVFSGMMNATLDHRAAADRNIIVCRALGIGDESDDTTRGGGPAELTLALLLACAWHIPAADALIRQGGWLMQPQTPLTIPLAGKTLGIVGYGSIGSNVGRYGKALGMKVLGFSRSLTEETARTDGITRSELEPLMRSADVISIHLPLTAQTRGMIGAREIGWIKPGAIFINTARAAIVDEAALLEALRMRRIAMGGFDVFSAEPLPRTHPLLQLTNVVMTPHIGYVSEAGMANRYQALLDVLVAYRRGIIKDRYTPSERDLASAAGRGV